MKQTMRTGRADRIMAIKRLPEFKNDFAEFLKIKKTRDRDLIFKKACELETKWGEPLELIEKADEFYYGVTKKGKILYCIRVVSAIEEEPIRKLPLREGEKVVKRQITGSRLYLEVDIFNATKEQLIEDFKRVISKYDPYLPELRKNKKRETKLDHWKVYDLYQERKNFLEVTREIFKVESSMKKEKLDPNYDERLLKQVRNAYKRAEKIIENTRLSLNLPPKPPQ